MMHEGSSNPYETQGQDRPVTALKCLVCSPEKKGDNMVQQYVSYKVNSTSTVQGGQETANSVVRRFSDFVWLHAQLVLKFPGLLIPPIPDKALMGKFEGEFISERQRGLQLFLDRVSVQKDLMSCYEVELFLSADEAALGAARDSENTAAAKFTGFMAFVKESVASMTPAKDRPKTQDDNQCEQIMADANSLETALLAVYNNADSLVRRNKDLAKNWFELGLACTLLGQYETNQNEESLGGMFGKVGNTSDRLSVLHTQKVEREQLHLTEQLKDALKLVDALKTMMKGRAQAEHYAAQDRLASRQAKLAQGKTEEAERLVIESQAQVDNTRVQLAKVTSSALGEAARFKREKEASLKLVMTAFVELQIDTARKVKEAWESVLPALK